MPEEWKVFMCFLCSQHCLISFVLDSNIAEIFIINFSGEHDFLCVQFISPFRTRKTHRVVI